MMADAGEEVRPSLKREHEDDDTISTPQNPLTYKLSSGKPISSLNFTPSRSPARSTTSSSGLSDAPSSIPPISPAPNALNALNGTAPPPAKRPKLTFQERELEKQRKEQEKLERAQAKSRRDADKEEQKRKTDAEREAKRVKLEAEKEERRIALEADKAAKLEKKKQQDAEKAAKEEEKKKKERSQKTLTSFFAKPKNPAKASASTSPGDEASGDHTLVIAPRKKKEDLSEYEKRFPPFFVHENVTMAPIMRWERDAARLDLVTSTIDKALQSWDGDASRQITKSESVKRQAFVAEDLFALPGNDFRLRGKTPRPVRDIMIEMNNPRNISIDSQNTQIKQARNLLSTIPYKFLQFAEDVRPPYRGTFTRPLAPGTAVKLARCPTRRELPDVDYDYDSEAEWVDGEGDDLDLDSEGEDEELDGTDEMDDFLDNEGQDELDRQQAMGMEPISTGLCWEDKYGRNLKLDGSINKDVARYQMEILCDPDVDRFSILPIDPHSTAYWPTKEAHPSPNTGLMNPPPLPLSTSKNTNSNLNGFLKPGDMIVTSKSRAVGAATEKKLISVESMQKFRDMVKSAGTAEWSTFRKNTVVDVLYDVFNKKETKGAIKATLDTTTIHDRTKGWLLSDSTA